MLNYNQDKSWTPFFSLQQDAERPGRHSFAPRGNEKPTATNPTSTVS